MAPTSNALVNKSITTAASDTSASPRGDSNDQQSQENEDSIDESRNTADTDDDDLSNVGTRTLKSNVWKFAKKISPGVAQCGTCGRLIKTSAGGTTSIRKHLINMHGMKSLANQSTPRRKTASSITRERKARLDHLLNLAIFQDGRTFGDFRRAGVMRFFAEAIPGKDILLKSSIDIEWSVRCRGVCINIL